jgi:hypothetical protein
VGLILGRSSTAIRGLQVYPDVIDEDYTGEIKIMAQAPGDFVMYPWRKNSSTGYCPKCEERQGANSHPMERWRIWFL